MACKIHCGEEEVAELGFDLVGVCAVDLGAKFDGLFFKFGEEAAGVRPVEAYFGSPGTELGGLEGCGHGAGDVVECGGGRGPGFLLFLLDLLPVAKDGGGVGGDGRWTFIFGKDMGVTTDEFGVEVFGDVVEVEVAGLGGHLRIEEDLQEEVAELVFEVRPGSALDGVEDLVGLFEGVAFDGVKGLLAVPWTAAGGAETSHDGGSTLKGRCCRCLGGFTFDGRSGIHAFSLPEVTERGSAGRPADNRPKF